MNAVTVTRGSLTPAEFAAVLAVLYAAGAARAAAPEDPARPSAWAQRSRGRGPLPPSGPGAWRNSALPQ